MYKIVSLYSFRGSISDSFIGKSEEELGDSLEKLKNKFENNKKSNVIYKSNSEWVLRKNFYEGESGRKEFNYFELTNGDISIKTECEDEDKVRSVLDAINHSECKFFQHETCEVEVDLERIKDSKIKLLINGKSI